MKPYLSLTPFIAWRHLPRPPDWSALFGRSAPMELEIGFGNGEHLVKRALSEPGRNLLGVDSSWPGVRRGLRRLALCPAKNVLVIQADAAVTLRLLFAPNALDRVEILFPVPWPNPKHAANRLLSRGFLRMINNRLKPGAKAVLITDHKGYFDWVKEEVPPKLFDTGSEIIGPTQNTKYERKWVHNGQKDFFRLELTKTGHAPPPAWEEFDLQHHHINEFDPRRFPLSEHKGDIFIAFKDRVYDSEQEKALVRTLVVEENFKQSIWLEFARQEGHWRLRAAPGCGLVPTLGVQKALELAAHLARES